MSDRCRSDLDQIAISPWEGDREKDTTYKRILLDVPDEHVAVILAAKAHEEVAVAGEAQVHDANLVRLVAASHSTFFVIPHDHHRLRRREHATGQTDNCIEHRNIKDVYIP